MARYRAEQIVQGEIEPARGTGQIVPEYAADVMQFLQLEEMHYDPRYAKEKESLAAGIIEEAKRYLKDTPNRSLKTHGPP